MEESANEKWDWHVVQMPRSSNIFVASSRIAHKAYQRKFHATWKEWTKMKAEVEDACDIMARWCRVVLKLEVRVEHKFLTELTKQMKAARKRLGAA